jgi:hypothetical protein
MEILETKKIVRVIKIPFLDLYNKKDLVLEDYKLSLDALVDIIIV